MSEMKPLRVAVIDDDALIRRTLSQLLDLEDDMVILDTGEDGRDAERIMQEDPDVMLLDMRMEGADGLSALEAMTTEQRRKVLILSTFDEDRYILPAVQMGAGGYILKNARPADIMRAVRQIASGQSVLGPEAMQAIRRNLQKAPCGNGAVLNRLTDREREVCALVAEGLNNKAVAEHLYLSEGTVKNYISTILDKTGLEHRTQIAIEWIKAFG